MFYPHSGCSKTAIELTRQTLGSWSGSVVKIKGQRAAWALGRVVRDPTAQTTPLSISKKKSHVTIKFTLTQNQGTYVDFRATWQSKSI